MDKTAGEEMADFYPMIWPEEPAPAEVMNCDDCGLIRHGSRIIWGKGNPAAPLLVILDNPGAREDRQGNPFVCGTRKTLQQAVHQVELAVEDVYLT